MAEEIKHYQINGRYKVQFERGATKGIIGYKVEANGDDINVTFDQAKNLMIRAEVSAPMPIQETK